MHLHTTCNQRPPSFREQNRVGSEICLAFLSLVLRVPEAQVAAHGDAGVEGLDAEVHRAVHVAKVRQLDPEQQQQRDVYLILNRISIIILEGIVYSTVQSMYS
jgi:hypothetical protein